MPETMQTTMVELMAESYQFLGDLFIGEPGGRMSGFVMETWIGSSALGFETTALPGDLRKALHDVEKHVSAMKVADALAANLEVEAEYAQLFVGPKPPPLHPYESVYRDRLEAGGQAFDRLLMGESVDHIRALWGRAGIEPVNPRNLAPDHLGLELSFMAALLDGELSADEARAKLYSDIARELFYEHLVAWVPAFCADARECDDARFFGTVCTAVTALLSAHKALVAG